MKIILLAAEKQPIQGPPAGTVDVQPRPPGVDIGSKFGFGDLTSLGEGTSRLVVPVFSIATFLVILYFLLGAFKYLKSQGNKEELEGAKQMIYHAIIGFMLLMLAFLILQYIPQFFNLPGLDIIK